MTEDYVPPEERMVTYHGRNVSVVDDTYPTFVSSGLYLRRNF